MSDNTPNNTPNSYYNLLNRMEVADGKSIIVTANYCCNIHAQGAWNPHEQHMAASTGVLTYELEKFIPRDDMRIGVEGGGYINSIYMKADSNNRAGNGIVWINNDCDMVENDANNPTGTTSNFVHLMGMVDTANGIVPRIYQPDRIEWFFPNLDLQIHLYRLPIGRWLGLQTVQQIGNEGIGLTSSILHDEKGAFGRSEQILTVRKV